MDLVTFHSLWTAALFVVFIGIVMWAYSSRRKATFEEYGRIPLDDDDATMTQAPRGDGGADHG